MTTTCFSFAMAAAAGIGIGLKLPVESDEDLKKKVDALEAECDALRQALAETHQSRHQSMAAMSDGLIDLNAKMNQAESSWTPWAEVKNVKDKLVDIEVDVLSPASNASTSMMGHPLMLGA